MTETFQLCVSLSLWLKGGEPNTRKLENDEPIQINTDLCVLCKNPRNGTNWGFLHRGEVHHNYCETCKINLDKKTWRSVPIV